MKLSVSNLQVATYLINRLCLYHTQCAFLSRSIINPRRACVRVTVVALCVCVCVVCVCVSAFSNLPYRGIRRDISVNSAKNTAKLQSGFL